MIRNCQRQRRPGAAPAVRTVAICRVTFRRTVRVLCAPAGPIGVDPSAHLLPDDSGRLAPNWLGDKTDNRAPGIQFRDSGRAFLRGKMFRRRRSEIESRAYL